MRTSEPDPDTGARSPSRPPGLSRSRQIILLLTVAALVGAGVFLGPRAFRAPEPANAPADASGGPSANGDAFKATPAQWADLKIEPVQMVDFPRTSDTDGKIASDDDLTTPVFSPYTGRVVRLFARAGDTVRRGDSLFAVQAAEFAQGQNDLISAVATLTTARAQLTLSEANEARQHALFLAHGAAEKDWQQARADLANARGGLNTAQIGVTAVRNRLRILGKTDQEIDAVENAADVRTLDPIGVVSAPIDGIVLQRQIGLGQNIVSAANGNSGGPQFQIGSSAKVWLVANVREEDAPRVHIGDPIEVSVLAYPNRVFRATITRVGASIDPVLHRLPVWAEIANPDGALKPEMFARFRIVNGPAEGASVAVPDRAVVHEGAEAHVWIANDADRTLAIRPIRVGRVTGGVAQVLEGLKPGEKVVTSGAVFIDRAAAGD
jgi:cobalt-zinc-cadmium efflux system membrane fusion protein